jgi:mannosyltransferase
LLDRTDRLLALDATDTVDLTASMGSVDTMDLTTAMAAAGVLDSLSDTHSSADADVAPSPVVRKVRRWRWRGWMLGVPPALLTLVIGGFRAGDHQLWEDEYATWHASTLDYPEFSRLIGHVDFALSPYYTFMHGWVTMFGDSPLAMRAPSILAMALTAGLLVQLGRRFFGPRVGLIAGLLFAEIPSVSWFAQEARPYAIAMFLATLATLLLLRAIDRPTWPRWTLYGGVTILLGLAHIVALSIMVAHLLAISYTARTEERLRLWRWLAPVIATAAVVGPFTLTASAQAATNSWIKADRPTLRAFPGQLFGSGAVAAALVGLAIIGIYLLVHSTGPQLPVVTAWAILPPVLTFATYGFLHLFYFRYLLFTVAAWVLLAAAGIDAIGRAMANRLARGRSAGSGLPGDERPSPPQPSPPQPSPPQPSPAQPSPPGPVLLRPLLPRPFRLRPFLLRRRATADPLARGRLSGSRRATGLAVVVTTVALAGVGWLSVPGEVAARHDPVIGYPDYRQAARTIGSQLKPGDSIAFGGLYFRARRGMSYEMRAVVRPHDTFLYRSAERLGGYVAQECPAPAACLGGTRRIWLVNTTASPDPFAELAPLVAAVLREQFTVTKTWTYQHLHLVLLTINPDDAA